MQNISKAWWIGLILSIISLATLFLSPSHQELAPRHPSGGVVELASKGPAEVISVKAEVTEEGPDGPEMVVYSTTSVGSEDLASQQVTVELPDGEAVLVEGADLALGKRFSISEASADPFRRPDTPAVDTPPSVFQTMAIDMEVREDLAEQRIVLGQMHRTSRPDVGEPATEPTTEPEASLVLTLTTGAFRWAESGSWELPIYVVARRRLENSDELAATTVPEAMAILVEASAMEPRTVTIEKGRTRSTEEVWVPLRRDQEAFVTATDVSGDAASASLTVSWEAHGPNSLALSVYPLEADGYATRLSPVHLYVHVELDGQLLRPGRELAILTSGPKQVTVEPTDAILGVEGEPASLKVVGHGDVEETLSLQMPDLDLDAAVSIRFRRPYLFLGLAAFFGVLGVVVSRRRPLFEQGKWAVALELLAACIGGVLLYAAFLMQWLPGPGFLVAALPASAVGVLGGYAGEGVYQLLLKITGLAR